MKKTRIWAVLLAVCMLTVSLCACQSAPVAETTPTPETTPENQTGDTTSRDETVDFVVVGAGAGGVSAAIEAARQGKSVILLEKLSFAGGSSALNEGYLWACGSEFNETTGKGYSVERMKEYLKESSRGNANEALCNNIVDVSGEVFDYLYENGVPFYTDQFTSSGGDAQDLDVFVCEGSGAALFQGMLSIAEGLGVTPRYESKAVALIVEDGAVKGVTVEDAQGTYNIYATNTILATGGFLKSEELMTQFMPEWYYENSYCSAGATGDGAKMALELGAYMVGYGCGGVWDYDGQNGYHMEGGLTPAVSFFMVNQEGERFCNEYMGSDKNQTILEQTNHRSYCFMDSTSAYTAIAEQGVATGIVQKADTLEELCEFYDIDTETFLKTVEDYNAIKASGEDKDPFGVPNAYMVSMSEPPFYATYFDPSMSTNCLMGLAADEYCRIITESGEPIPNLYGVGELIIGNLCGGTKEGARYPACGTCLAAGIYGSVVAVRHAVGQ